MNRTKIIVLLAMLVFCLGRVNTVIAQEGLLANVEDLEISGDYAFYSQYISKGFVCDTDPVFQSGIYVRYKGIQIGVWGSYDIDNDDPLKSEELDFLFDFTHQFDNVSISLGHIYYDLIGTNAHAKDFYFGLGFDVLLSPTLTFYYDYVSPRGTYTVLNLAHSVPMGETPLSLELAGHIAYNHEYGIKGEGGDYGFRLGVNIPLTEKLTFTPNINYVVPFGDVRANDDGGQKDRIYGGCVLSWSF